MMCKIVFGVQVAIIEPGPIKTAWGEIAAGHLEESVSGHTRPGFYPLLGQQLPAHLPIR